MIAQEAKFELLKYRMHGGDGAFTEYLVKLHDADGVIVHYNITDYYNESEEIIDTRIWKLSDKILDDLYVKSDSDSEKMCFVTDKGSFYFCSYSDNFSKKILSFDNLKNIINSKLIKVEKEINSDHDIEKTYKFLTESKKSIILRVKLKSKIKMITVNCCESYCGYHDCCCSCCCNDERIVKHIPDGGIKRFLTDNVTNIDILKSYFDVKKDKIQ